MTNSLRCVIDASVGIKLFIPDPLSRKVKLLFERLGEPDTEFFIPDLFYIESANIIWKYIRADQYSISDLARDIASLKALSFQVMSTAHLMEEAVIIGSRHRITAYDAAYVALSSRVNAPLLTLDRKLIEALSETDYDVRSFVDFPLDSLDNNSESLNS